MARRLQVIGGGHRHAPTRQQTLRAALDWSHSLLSAHEQMVFRRLGIFVGSIALETAVAVAGEEALDAERVIDALAALVDRSLVVADDADPPRYYLLESPREYALLKLEQAGELQALQQRHARAVADVVNLLLRALVAAPGQGNHARVRGGTGQLRAALEWSAVHQPAIAVELMGVAPCLFALLDLGHEAQRRSAQIDALVTDDIDPAIVARYWHCRARHQFGVDHRRMHDTAVKSVALFRRLGDDQGLYLALAVLLGSGRVPRADSKLLVDEMLSLERAEWPPKARAPGRAGLATLHYFEQRHADAAACYERAKVPGHRRRRAVPRRGLHRPGERWRTMRSATWTNLCVCAGKRSCNGAAHGVLNLPLGALALGLTLQGNLDQAREAFAELFTVCRAPDWHLFDMFDGACLMLALTEGRHETAARLLGYASHRSTKLGVRVLEVERIDRRERPSKTCSNRRPWSD